MTDALLQQIVDRTIGFEGACTWMYQDIRGLVTCGVGHRIFSQAEALGFPWRTSPETLAGRQQIADDYQAVLGAPGGHTAEFYEELTTCRMLDEDIQGLCRLDLVSRLATLRSFLPDLDCYPEGPQAALADMIFNLGGSFIFSWPKLYSAVLSNRWAEAAAQCHRRGIGEVRNRVVAGLFISVVQVAGGEGV